MWQSRNALQRCENLLKNDKRVYEVVVDALDERLRLILHRDPCI
jgi:hypothetical protein